MSMNNLKSSFQIAQESIGKSKTEEFRLLVHSNTEWDKYILTISMAAIGFSATFWAAEKQSLGLLLPAALIFLGVSILSCVASFRDASKNIRHHVVESSREHNLLNGSLSKILHTEIQKITSDEASHKDLDQRCVDSIIEQLRGFDKDDLSTANRYAERVEMFNEAKHWSFMLGVVFLTFHVLNVIGF